MPEATGPEWVWEAGIGETRAALIDRGTIIEAAVELDDGGLRVGHVAPARLIDRHAGRVRLAGGHEAQLIGAAGVAEGGLLTVAITREALPEPGRVKLPRAVVTDAEPTAGPDLIARITASGLPARQLAAHAPDLLEAAGWSELLDEAVEGEIVFPDGALRMTPTPAMTLFDVDGSAPLEPLAIRAAAAVARAIRRHGIGGSIGIDFPTLGGKTARQAVAVALDADLPPPFERTAVNGFGFLQVIRPRARASLPELLRADPIGAAVRALLRGLEREPPGGARLHKVPPAYLTYLQTHPAWIATLVRRTGLAHQFEAR